MKNEVQGIGVVVEDTQQETVLIAAIMPLIHNQTHADSGSKDSSESPANSVPVEHD